MTTSHHRGLDELTHELLSAGWIRQAIDVRHTPTPESGVAFEVLTQPRLGLEIEAVSTGGNDFPSIGLHPQPEPGEPFRRWSAGIFDVPLAVILAAAHDACANIGDQTPVFERLAHAGWTLAEQTFKGSKPIFQHWISPDGERAVWWSRYGRNQSTPGSWSITWPPHALPCPYVETGLSTPPAVICAFAQTN